MPAKKQPRSVATKTPSAPLPDTQQVLSKLLTQELGFGQEIWRRSEDLLERIGKHEVQFRNSPGHGDSGTGRIDDHANCPLKGGTDAEADQVFEHHPDHRGRITRRMGFSRNCSFSSPPHQVLLELDQLELDQLDSLAGYRV